MTLLLLAIAATVLAAVCRQSLGKSVRAAREAQQLQRRWGALSCRSTFLPRAERALMLARQHRGDGRPVAVAEYELSLGGQQYTLTFADEQAKIDVGALYARRGRTAVERLARDAGRAAHLGVRLRPLSRLTPGGGRAATFGSLGQVFDENAAEEAESGANSHGGAAALRAASLGLTCWGGKLNWRRSTPADLEAWCDPVLDPAEVRQLLLIRQAPGGSMPLLDQALARLQWTDEKQRSVRSLLTNDSECHSLWIETRWRGGAEHRLAVLEEKPGAAAETHCFCW